MEPIMVQFVGMLDEADEFQQSSTVNPVKDQGAQRTAARQAHILRLLATSGQTGATSKDTVAYLRTNFDPEEYHGPVSSTLTALHKAGRIVRLTEKRNRFNVYVLPEHVAGRETIAPVQSKGRQEMFGLKDRTAVDTSAADAKIAALQQELERLNTTLDAVTEDRDGLQVRLTDATQKAATAERVKAHVQRENSELEFTLGNVKRLRDTALDTVERQTGEMAAKDAEIRRLKGSVADMEAELAQPAAPRKTLTAEEKKILDSVASVMNARYPTDGTPDNPARITLRVSTVRTLGRALSRLTSD